MEAVVRSVMSSHSSASKEGRGAQVIVSRELYHVLRRLGPCACRHHKLFTEIALDSLRLQNQVPKPESYLTAQRIVPTTLKCTGPLKVNPEPLNFSQVNLINLLIDQLCAESFEEAVKQSEGGACGSSEGVKMEEEVGENVTTRRSIFDDPGRRRVRHGSYRRQVPETYDDDDLVSEDMTIDADLVSETGLSRQASATGGRTTSPAMENSSETKNGSNKQTEKPLLSKAAVLRLLAELVESYPSCAKLIAESSRKIKIDSHPAKDMPVLAFIFDHLLPGSFGQTATLPAITKLAKTFLQSLATAHYSPEAISVLVMEFKNAFARALALPDSLVKHGRLRALTGLLSQILDVMTPRGQVNPTHFARLLIRKGFISDLARAVHNLNMNSTHLTGTVNSILKPLEVLTKIVNHVAATQRKLENAGQKLSGVGFIAGESSSNGVQSSATNREGQGASMVVSQTQPLPSSADTSTAPGGQGKKKRGREGGRERMGYWFFQLLTAKNLD